VAPLTTTEMVGFTGVAIAGIAYLPQITHLITEHCSAGISRLAFGMWLISSLLVTAHAVATHAEVFVILGAVQLVSTAIILVFGTRYQGSFCPVHRPCPPEPPEGATDPVPMRVHPHLPPSLSRPVNRSVGVRADQATIEESP
jgi:uncharacterized protein with PQ loop repeat